MVSNEQESGGRAGAGKSMEQWLREAVLADPATAEGQGLRASVGAMHMEQARALILRSANAPADEAMALREAARKSLAGALLAGRVHLETAPAVAAPAVACLLDPPPGAPTGVMAAATALGAHVVWTEPNAYGESVSYKLDVSPPPLLPVIAVNGAEAQVAGLAPGNVYSFTVTATNADGTGPASMASNTVKVGAPTPTAPGGLVAMESGAGVSLSWTAGAGGGALTAQVVRAYDAAKPGVALAEQKLDGAARQATFPALAKGSYVFGVRPYSEGGFGPEAQSAAFQHTPAPVVVTPNPYVPPPLPGADSLMLFDLGDAVSSVLDPTALRRRMMPIVDKATQWRYDHLKGLAVTAARDTVGYDQLLAQMMQMTLGKVVGAQSALNAVLPELIDGIGKTASVVENLAASDLVKGVVKKVGDAAASLLALEGLIHFLIDKQPLAFWTGLFDGLISDIAHFDRDLTDTNKFLHDYFDGAGAELINTIKGLVTRIDSTVHDTLKPLRCSVAQLSADVQQGLKMILNELEETVVSATAPFTGPDGTTVKQFFGNSSGLMAVTAVVDEVTKAIDTLEGQLRDLLDAALQDPRDLCVSLIKAFIVYPILGILVVSFAGGPIAAGILGAIVCVAGVELIRLVARWLTGPLNGVLNDAENALIDTVKELQDVLQKVVDLVPKSLAKLEYVAASLAGLAHLLPQAFLKDVAQLIGGARRALLSQATELALSAERALGLENATAFDILKPGYESKLFQAPDLPGGTDPTLFAGAALLRDFNLLDHARTGLLNAKETTVTLRLSLFKMLGGLGNPATFTGDAAKLFQTFLKGGPLLLKLDEKTLIEQGFPGLYRALVVDVKPVGLLAAASSAVPILPAGIPLTITHLGASRIRVKRHANPSAPPIALPDVLRLSGEAVKSLIASPDKDDGTGGNTGPLLLAFVDELVATLVPQGLDPTKVDFVHDTPVVDPGQVQSQSGMRFDPTVVYRDQLIQRLRDLTQQLLTRRLSNLLDPVVAVGEVSRQVAFMMDYGNPHGYPVFGYPGEIGSIATNDDAGRQRLRDLIKQECLGQLDSVSRQGSYIYKDQFGAARALRALLSPTIDAGRELEMPKWAARVAKWGGARFDRERDPQIESLGFVTLVQDFAEESAAFNLLPDISSGLTGALGGVAAGFLAANPARGADPVTQPVQYRPFENRGVEGEWLLNLESPLNPGSLIDLLLEVTVRGCYDDALGAAVKASRQQSGQLLARAEAVASAANKTLRMPGSLPVWDTGTGPVRTIHFSLRAHREKLLQSVNAALDALGTNPDTVDGLKLDRKLAIPLRFDEALKGIGVNPINSFALQFHNSQSGLSMDLLHGLLAVTPADLGLGADDPASMGQVEAVSFAVIPSGKLSDGHTRVPVLQDFQCDKALLPLLPQLDPSNKLEYQGPPQATPAAGNDDKALRKLVPQKLLYIARTPAAAPVSLASVFNDAAKLTLNFGDALQNGHIHDVIFSLSVRRPLPQLTVSSSVIGI